MQKIYLVLAFLATALLTAAYLPEKDNPNNENTGWSEYLGGPDRNHYSSLTQINKSNVSQLKVAWEYHTLDSGQVQCNPIIVNGVMYAVTATNKLFALDAATGKELWKFTNTANVSLNTNRGVTYWESKDKNDADVPRIVFALGSYLYAVDAKTGQPIERFGDKGKVSLKEGLGSTAINKFVISNTPGTLYEDNIIMPLRLSEGADAALGNVQAFNVRTGKLSWVFHTIPEPNEFGYNTWPKNTYKNTAVGGANNWAGMAVDRKRGIVFVPTGSAAFDFYGGNRKGQNLFANCLIALDAHTGKRLWHFQFVHHDIWDKDLPAPPNLVTITKNGKKIDAVAQVTKTGHVFVFDRVTGKPLFPIKETPFPKSTIPEESTWSTQPIPTLPAPFSRQTITEADVNPYSDDKVALLKTIKSSQRGLFQPLNKKETLLYPGADGGAEWGGAAVDPDGIMYVNANEMAWIFSLKSTPKEDELAHLSPGQRLYTNTCLVCHGKELKGNPKSGYPSLVDISQRRDREYVTKIIASGKGMMPGFGHLSAIDRQALVAFLFGDEKVEATVASSKAKTPYIPYQFNGYNKFIDAKGYPGIRPPWGTLTAIDLNTGKQLWQKPFGEYPELKAKGIPTTGSENYGGPVVTASGLLFIAATKDGMFRIFDKKTGDILWETKLPAAGFATPSTYLLNGKQYIVIACGGTKLGTKKGDSYIAFSL
ncbi:PQQ-binding-like beta-propeller repeat protein [Arcicella aquatica]|uniref:PQQ-binding-like beta-propeller repeat protein n=1 Tax=Arcicella aquatica TaxID=217141 RepID=A0ABU5QTU4_9BACT|nr:PQQ-binding-like beta-propeller repeat protein [Arcicella aquatica]MEA5260433.1 PQQ-binding-like beta-propeller repeat protein [Arcicella aquatica]